MSFTVVETSRAEKDIVATSVGSWYFILKAKAVRYFTHPNLVYLNF